MKISRDKKGFTLIELLIVVAIIGILAAIAIPAYTGYTKKAKLAGVINSMGAVKNALVAYYTEQGAGPSANLADAAAIGTLLGVTPATEYAGYTYTAGTRTITATAVAGLNLGAGQDLTLAADATFQNWTWGGTCDTSYIPKK